MIAVVGAGYWGKNHLRNFAELGALSAICEADPAVLARFRDTYPGITIYRSLDEVLTDPAVQGVTLATPAADHFSGAMAALAAGRHVLIEKPITMSTTECEQLVRTARERGLVLMAGHLLEFHPAFVKLKEMVVAGELGELRYLYSNRLSLGDFRRVESVLWDFAPHDLSMVLRLAGELPTTVQANGSVRVTAGVEDAVTLHLTFPRGVRAHIYEDWLHPFKEQRLVVVGTKQMAVFDDVVKEGKLTLYPTHVARENGRPVPVMGEPHIVAYPASEPLQVECEHFLACIRTGAEPLTGGESALAVTRVLEACEQSLKSEGRRIALTEPSA